MKHFNNIFYSSELLLKQIKYDIIINRDSDFIDQKADPLYFIADKIKFRELNFKFRRRFDYLIFPGN